MGGGGGHPPPPGRAKVAQTPGRARMKTDPSAPKKAKQLRKTGLGLIFPTLNPMVVGSNLGGHNSFDPRIYIHILSQLATGETGPP